MEEPFQGLKAKIHYRSVDCCSKCEWCWHDCKKNKNRCRREGQIGMSINTSGICDNFQLKPPNQPAQPKPFPKPNPNTLIEGDVVVFRNGRNTDTGIITLVHSLGYDINVKGQIYADIPKRNIISKTFSHFS